MKDHNPPSQALLLIWYERGYVWTLLTDWIRSPAENLIKKVFSFKCWSYTLCVWVNPQFKWVFLWSSHNDLDFFEIEVKLPVLPRSQWSWLPHSSWSSSRTWRKESVDKYLLILQNQDFPLFSHFDLIDFHKLPGSFPLYCCKAIESF